MWLRTYLDEINSKYGLNETEIITVLLEAVEQFYSHLLRCPVLCELNNNGVSIRKYNNTGSGYSENLLTLRYTDIHNIKEILQERYESLLLLRTRKHLKTAVHTALRCTFIQYIDDDACLSAENSGINQIKAICSKRDTPHHERGKYKKGFSYWFFVKTIADADKPTLRISRTSKRLVDELFRQQGDNVKCIYRIAGAKSHIRATRKIDKKHIIRVSNELKERIIVEF